MCLQPLELELCGSGLSNLQIYMIDCKPIIPPSQGSLSQNTRNMGPVQDFLSPDNGPSVSDIDNIRGIFTSFTAWNAC